MQMLPPNFNRAPLLTGAFCLMLATLFTGCTSKNPLMEEPAPRASASKPAKTVAAEPAPAKVAEEKIPATTPAIAEAPKAAPPEAAVAAAPAAPVAAAAAAETKTATGVQTKRENRFLGLFRPYRPDVQQGNFVSQEMVAQLKEGMTQDQVVFLLGTPLLTDVFHAERWDYAFRLQKGDGEITTSRVTVFFKDKLVSRFEGGDLPTEKDYLERIADKAKAANK